MTTTKQLRALLASATPGEWTAGGGGHDPSPRLIYTLDEDLFRDADIADVERVEDAALICAAVNALPKLIAVVEAAEAHDRYVDEKLRHGRGTTIEVALRRALAALEES